MTGIDQEQDRLIAAYIRGTADPEAVARLEEAMLDDDELFERVQQEALLQRGLKTTLMESDSPATSKSTIWRWPGFALIGTLGLAVVVLGGINVHLNGELEQLRSPHTDVPVITLFEERSLLTESIGLVASRQEGPVLIEIDVSASEQDRFQLELKSANLNHSWENLTPDDRGYVTVYLPHVEFPLQLEVLNEFGQRIRSYTLE